MRQRDGEGIVCQDESGESNVLEKHVGVSERLWQMSVSEREEDR